ncbi:GAF and ANTAR domain-containing protein [Nocardioides donggukensis]|uniref:GAF and ANTAR domain-containing protein n=1 Tax=Nocardioides donggukensis TaxID=2774019 RepID=A0A927K3N8_9ACTN|nr:GAF and ANTAR domain-containing protein [Nocardioides donggukensis]MBD8869814.1 GAF and ANTAR domain-containing protein [Nocardioides donggukensis]
MAAPDHLPLDHDPAAFFARLSHELFAQGEEHPTLEAICHGSLAVLPAAEFCGITVRRRRHRLETVCSSDPLADACDELQYQLDEGPCVDSAREDEPYLVHETGADPRWPRWGPRVAKLGVHSIVSVQLTSSIRTDPDDPLGAINIYSRRPEAFTEDDLALALVYATHAGNALASVRQVSGLQAAMHGRHLIGVAQGVLMQRYELTMEQAFETLQRYSSHANVKLREVAETVIAEGRLPSGYESMSRVEPDPV